MTNPTVRATVATVNVAVGVGTSGPPGPAGPSSSSYEHTQAVAASTWVVNHNLGYRPVVSIYSVGGVEVDATVVHLSLNVAQISFVSPYAGFARCV